MDEREFVNQKRAGWDRLAALVAKAGGKQGVRALSRDDLLTLGPLYRRVSSDLAYARAHAVSPDLTTHLNGLAGRAHALLYEAETSGSPARSVLAFYLYEFPALLQKRVGYFLVALAVSVLGGLFAYWLVITQPEKLDLFIPAQLRASVEMWKNGAVGGSAQAEFSSQLFINNQTVGLIAFASGLAGGVLTVYMMFENGAMLGAMAALMTQVHRHNTFWPGILPHGIAELTAIFICGGAGLLLGKSLLLPGDYARRDALKLAGLDAIKLVLGSLPLFIFAGIIEGMFSHLPLAPALRYTFAGVNGVMWYLYLFLPRRNVPVSPQNDSLPPKDKKNLIPS